MLEIWKYVAAENENAAEKVLARINDVFLLLVSQPEAGRCRPELSKAVRSFRLENTSCFTKCGLRQLTLFES
jgi:toxin ParE1/3/4